MEKLTWLHLSDWHQKGKDFDRDVVRDALVDDLKNRAVIDKGLEHVDFLAFSGDVAFHGKAEEYQTAIREFFEPLLQAAGVERDRLFMVPGNHDLEWAALELLPNDLLQRLSTAAKVNEWLANPRKRRVLLEPMVNYSDFVREYLGRKESDFEPAYGCVYHLEAAGKTIAVVGLNSAWLCARHREGTDGEQEVNDYGRLILGETQLHEAMKEAASAHVRIAILHHPPDWFATTDSLAEKSLIRGRLSRDFHFVLHGHEHEPNMSLSRSLVGNCVSISAGSSYERRRPTSSRYANGYNLVHLDFSKMDGVVYFRRYEDRQGWIRDTGTTGDDTPGYCRFALPAVLARSEPYPISTPTTVNLKEKTELVDAFLGLMSVSDRITRDTVVNNLPADIRNTIARHAADRVDVFNIVDRCLDFPDGIEQLLEIVRFYEGDSIGMQKLDALLSSRQN